MALRHLGPAFDVHTGGVDNVYPHHEDEIAQSAPLTGAPPARVWSHGAHLLARGRKMAKSAGNFARITELAAAGHEPLAFRYLCLTSRHGRSLSFSEESLAAAGRALASLRAGLRGLGPPPDDGPWRPPPALEAGRAPDRPVGRATAPSGHGAGEGGTAWIAGLDRAHAPDAPLSAAGRALRERIVAAVDDDLDVPVALATVREVLRADLPAAERRWIVLDADLVLGLDLHRAWSAGPGAGATTEVPATVRDRVAARAAARARRDFATADAIRADLEAGGWRLDDTPDGTTVERRTGATG
jgi:cysteinyl-tRNA synthetase